MNFALLGSGSSGNATIVSSPTATVLIDAGLSFKQLQLRAMALGVDISAIDAVLVTHEHGDHVNGLPVLTKRVGVPVYMTHGTFDALSEKVKAIPNVQTFDPGDSVAVGAMRFDSYSVSHDAADPVGYVVDGGGRRLGLAGDMGHVSTLVKQRLAGCDALVLESNYCPDMLLHSPYPAQIRQRIGSRHGHLSNPDACSLLKSVMHDGLRLVVLTHLSEENNRPDKVMQMASRAMNGHRAEIHVAWQDKPTPLFSLIE